MGFEDTSNNKVCLSQRTSAKRMYEMYIASHEEHNVDGTRGMDFLLESGFLSEPYACLNGGQYSWKVEDGHVSVYVDDIKVMDFVDENLINSPDTGDTIFWSVAIFIASMILVGVLFFVHGYILKKKTKLSANK